MSKTPRRFTGSKPKRPRKRLPRYAYPEYRSWRFLRARCLSSSYRFYKNYGGRGISVCKRWRVSFWNFLKDMGRKPSKNHTIERIDNNGNYTPKNCRWATAKEQGNNTRRSVFINFKGKRDTVANWARKLGMKQHTVAWRIRAGWDRVRALILPPIRGKLNPSKVARIRRMYRSGKTQREIAGTFGVTAVTIGDIIKGRTWKGVA